MKTELSYVPSGSPLVLSIQTDPNSTAVKQAQELSHRFPIVALAESALASKLQQIGINYSADIRPLFGNPLVLAAAHQTLSGSASSQFILAWVTKDADKLSSLAKKISGGHSTGSHDGATLYSFGSSGATIAVSGETAIAATSQSLVTAALDRHAGGGSFSSTDQARETTGLPKDALVEVFGDLSTVLSTPSTAKARHIPWVAALRGYGAAISASGSGLSVSFHLDTTAAKLSSSQLPLAPGSSPPALAGSNPITAAVHNPAQTVTFVEAVEQISNPSTYASFQRRQRALRARTGSDLNTLIAQMTGDLIISSDTHATMGRASVSNAAAAAKALVNVMSDPKLVFTHATGVTKLPGGFYAVHDGRKTINVGMAGSQLVAGNVPPSRLGAFAAASTTPAVGAQGAAAFRIGLRQLIALATKRPLSQTVRSVLNQLGDITGWMSASPEGLTGNATLAVR